MALVRAQTLLDEEKDLKKASKKALVALEETTKKVIEGLTDVQCDELLAAKWIEPLQSDLLELPRYRQLHCEDCGVECKVRDNLFGRVQSD